MAFNDEKKLVKMLQQGDEEAWRYLIAHYSGAVKAATLRYNLSSEDREDVVQEAFFRIYKSLSNYNHSKSSLSTFFSTITKRVCIDRFRKPSIKAVPICGDLKSAPTSSEEDDKNKVEVRLRTVIKELPREQRLVIYLFYFSKCPYKRIAEIMNTDLDRVKNILHRTRKKLEQTLKNNIEN